MSPPERAGTLDRALSPTNDLPACADRAWTKSAVCRLEADVSRSSDTHLIPLRVPALDGLHLYFKDESTHPTGSLKHRLARSLFLFAICNGWIHEGTPVVEASSGSTAVSEAYFARLLDLPFYAVMPAGTSPEKVAAIEFYGGRCHFVDEPAALYDESRRLARELGGHYLDQFTFAERATDWRGNNNIAESMFGQMRLEPYPVPSWVVMSAGTGGTSATIGRYVRYRHLDTKLSVVDVENSVFYDNVTADCDDLVTDQGSLIEGIGRPDDGIEERRRLGFIADGVLREIKRAKLDVAGVELELAPPFASLEHHCASSAEIESLVGEPEQRLGRLADKAFGDPAARCVGRTAQLADKRQVDNVKWVAPYNAADHHLRSRHSASVGVHRAPVPPGRANTVMTLAVQTSGR